MVDNLKNVKLMVLPQVNSSGNQTQQYQLALLHSFERAKVPKISVAYCIRRTRVHMPLPHQRQNGLRQNGLVFC